jgi:type IV pilus assembly protein PilA
MKALAKTRGFTLIELMIVVAILSILAAIAIPNFIRFQARSKKGEARTNLKGIYSAEKAYFQEKDNYTSNFGILGFAPERGNRFAYDIGNNIQQARNGPTIANNSNFDYIQVDVYTNPYANSAPTATISNTASLTAPDAMHSALGSSLAGLSGAVGAFGDFVASATGNIDSDAYLELMAVSSQGGTQTGVQADTSEGLVPGIPFELADDVHD